MNWTLHSLSKVVQLLGGPYGSVQLRAACVGLAASIPKPPKRNITIAELLAYATSTCDIATFIFLKENLHFVDTNAMASCAAIHHCTELAKLAYEWSPKPETQFLLHAGATYGCRAICELAKDMGHVNFNDALMVAARSQKYDICELMIEYGATDIHRLIQIASAFDLRLCKIAVEWMCRVNSPEYSKENFDLPLYAAVEGHQTDIIEYFESIDRVDYSWLLEYAAFCDNAELCWKAFRNHTTNYNAMLLNAAEGGSRECCVLAHNWGATDLESMLRVAISSNFVGIAELAVQWGVPNYKAIILEANNDFVTSYFKDLNLI